MTEPNQLTTIELNVDVLKQIEQADRSKWDSETYISMGMEISQIKGLSQWFLGKLASEYCEVKKYGMVTEYARSIRQDPSSLRVYKSVYERFQKADANFVPDGFVPWGVLLTAAGSKNPVEMVNQLHDASANTIEEAYRAVKVEQTGKELPPKPKLKLQFDEMSGKWKIVLEPNDIPKIDWTDIKKQLTDYFESL
jgi:hypothetical protein